MRRATIKDIDNIVRTILPEMDAGHFREILTEDCARFFAKTVELGLSGPTGREVRTWTYIYEVGGIFAGFAVVRDKPNAVGPSHYPDNTKEFWMFSVTPEFRKKGHGKSFAQEVIQQQPSQHLIALCKNISEKMKGILIKLGFVELGQLRGEENETLLFLDVSGVTLNVKASLQQSGIIV